MKRLLLFCTLLFLSSCATGPTYKDTLQSYVGRPAGDVFAKFGAPTQSFEHGNQKYVTFHESGGAVAMTNPYMYGAVMAIPRYCKTTFVINQSDLIESFSYEGNMCQ